MKELEGEDRLWRAYREQKDQDARARLISAYTPMIKQVAGRMALYAPPGADVEDLLGYGAVGLIQAVDRFEPARGVKFSTFAQNRIRGAILDGLRQLDWRSRSSREREKDLQEALARLEQRLGRSPSDRELAAEMGLNLNELEQRWQEASQGALASLEEGLADQRGGDSAANLRELLAGSPEQEPERRAQWNELRKELGEAVGRLPEKERLVVALYYYEELTLKEIGAVLDVSESRVSQLHGRALMRLRGSLARRKREFLE